MKKTVVASLLALSLMLVAAAPASAGLKLFQSPSGNIGCAITVLGKAQGNFGGVRCDIGSRSWATPKTPKSCHLDYGNGLEVGKRGRAHFACAGDTVLHQGSVLPYGSTARIKNFVCKSLTIGMRCVNRKTGHGFKLSIQHARRF